MSPSVTPDLTIAEALALLETRPRLRELSFEEAADDNRRYVVQRPDLETMARMGLGTLPVDAIAIPPFSPMLRPDGLEIRARHDYSHQLTRYLPPFFVAALVELNDMLKREAHEGRAWKAYLIGGIVREMLLAREPLLNIGDVDVTVEGDAMALAERIAAGSKNFRLDATYPEFGTAKLEYKDRIHFDLASTRREVYRHCGALPEVIERGVPLASDVLRRDFTINALSLSLNPLGEVLDYSNGIADIQDRLIRILHPASFFEDPSRLIRALRFEASLGFERSRGTARLFGKFFEYADPVYKGGGDRVKAALKTLVTLPESPQKHKTLQHLMDEGVWRLFDMRLPAEVPAAIRLRLLHVHPHIQAAMALAPRPEDEEANDVEVELRWQISLCLWLADLDDEMREAAAHRLGLTRADRDAVERFRRYGNAVMTDLREDTPPERVWELFSPLATPAAQLSACLIHGDPPMALACYQRYRKKWANLKPELNGEDLIALGIPEGALIGMMLRKLQKAKLAGRCVSRLEEIRFVQQQLENKQDTTQKDIPQDVPK